jgi:SNF2 family DNA or RNA helicase
MLEKTDFTFHTKPYAHQLEAFARSRNEASFALLMEMGTGKSKVTCDNIAYLREQDKIDCAVILAPKGVHTQWINEQLPTHFPPRIPRKDWLFFSHKNPPAWLFQRNPSELIVVSMNLESMSHDSGKTFLKSLLREHGLRTFVAVDESSRIKTPGATRTKTLRNLRHLIGYRRILTGTPITQGLQDLYAQFGFLDPAIIGVPSFEGFRARYCVTEAPRARNVSPHAYRIVGYQNVEELLERVGRASYSVAKSDCLDLPDKVYVTREVEMSPVQQTHYKALKKHALTVLDSGDVVSPQNALELLLRLQQVVCGHVQGQMINPCPRITVLGDVVEEAGKTIVWSRFKADVARICEELRSRRLKYVVHTGDTPSEERADVIKQFQTDPDTRVFVATAASGGIGLNLTQATTVVYYSNAFSLELRLQSEDRAHRIGQTQHVTYVDLVSPNTIDTRIVSALRGKQDVASMAIDTLRGIIAT